MTDEVVEKQVQDIEDKLDMQSNKVSELSESVPELQAKDAFDEVEKPLIAEDDGAAENYEASSVAPHIGWKSPTGVPMSPVDVLDGTATARARTTDPVRSTIEPNPVKDTHENDVQLTNCDTVSVASVASGDTARAIPVLKVNDAGTGRLNWYWPDKDFHGDSKGTHWSINTQVTAQGRVAQLEAFHDGTQPSGSFNLNDRIVIRKVESDGKVKTRYADSSYIAAGLNQKIQEEILTITDTVTHHQVDPHGLHDDHGNENEPYNYMLLGLKKGEGRSGHYTRNKGNQVDPCTDSRNYLGKSLYIQNHLLVDGEAGGDSANDTGLGVGQFHGGISAKKCSYFTRGSSPQAIKVGGVNGAASDTMIVKIMTSDTYALYAENANKIGALGGSTYGVSSTGPTNTDSAYYVTDASSAKQVVGPQHNTTGETAGFSAGVGSAVNDDSTFTGNSGTKAYTIGDIVKHLKKHGLLASS